MKNRKNDKERVFFREKKRFHLCKSLLYKNGKAQNMPVVARRFVEEKYQKYKSRKENKLVLFANETIINEYNSIKLFGKDLEHIYCSGQVYSLIFGSLISD